MNENLDRWIISSLVQNFNVLSDVYFYVEGAPDSKSQHDCWIEFRVDGPVTTQQGASFFQVDVVPDLLVQASSERNIYKLASIIGRLRPLFDCISVYDDDDNEIGVLTVVDDIEVINYGKIEGQPHVRAAIRSLLRMDYEEDA